MSRYQLKPKINYSPGPWKDDISDFGDLSLNTSRTTWWYPNGTADRQIDPQHAIDARLMSYTPEMYELAYQLASIDDTFISAAAMIAAIEKAREIVGQIDGSYWT